MPNGEGQLLNPGHPKLRNSCDACGAAKLRCDRGQPACGRCVSHGTTCVYGLSRKMGKPPRQKLRQASLQASSDQVGGEAGESGSSNPFSADPNTNITDYTLTFDAFNNTAQSMADLDSFDYDDWPDIDYLHGSILSPGAHLRPNSPMQSPQATDPSYVQHSVDHNCARTAHEMFGSLSFFNRPAILSSSSSGDTASINEVPLDHVLSITRKVSEQLLTLLGCPCASNPSLALLHASIVARIFAWYHDITMSIYNASICQPSGPHQILSQLHSNRSSSDSNTASTTPSSLGCPSLVSISVSSTSIAIGQYSINDQAVEGTVKIQLVLGEMKRARELKLKHTQHHDPARSLEGLVRNLNNWLAGEHSRVLTFIKSKLSDLEAH